MFFGGVKSFFRSSFFLPNHCWPPTSSFGKRPNYFWHPSLIHSLLCVHNTQIVYLHESQTPLSIHHRESNVQDWCHQGKSGRKMKIKQREKLSKNIWRVKIQSAVWWQHFCYRLIRILIKSENLSTTNVIICTLATCSPSGELASFLINGKRLKLGLPDR